MLLRRFFDDKLAQASYMIGCQATGEALVVDPHRDSDVYVRAAAGEDMTIAFVAETHIHADYLSGARQLARTTGATLLLSGDGDDDWQHVTPFEQGYCAGNLMSTHPPVDGVPGFCGLENGERWRISKVDLSAYLGSADVRVRFVFGSDDFSEKAGWYISDFDVQVD